MFDGYGENVPARHEQGPLPLRTQLEVLDEYPDVVYGCIGGGSSFSGLFWPFYHDKVAGKAPKDVRFVAVESTACPSVSKGVYMYDHGDAAGLTPLMKMHTLGHDFIPPPIHAGGLRYHGMAPTLCLLANEGVVEVEAYNQVEVFEAASMFVRAEGILPAPEPAHAIRAAINEALRCRETGEEEVILFLLCGHGHFDMMGYRKFLDGELPPYEYPEEEVRKAIDRLLKLYPWIKDL